MAESIFLQSLAFCESGLRPSLPSFCEFRLRSCGVLDLGPVEFGHRPYGVLDLGPVEFGLRPRLPCGVWT